MNKAIAAVGASLALAGCAPTKTFHSAFDDITHDTRSTVNELVTYRQLVSLNGLMPAHVPGMLYFEPTSDQLAGKHSPGLLIGLSPKRSMVVQTTYASKDEGLRVAAVQKNYQALRQAAIEAVAARLRASLFSALERAPEKSGSRERLVKMLSLPDEVSAADVKTARDAARNDEEVKRKALAQAQAAFNDGLGDNMLVARWTRKQQFEGTAALADLVGLSSGEASEESGVLILGGIRVVNTFLGEDLYCMAKNAVSNRAQADYLSRASVTINSIQARAVAYVSDLDLANTLAMSLSISKDQLKGLLEDGLIGAMGDAANVKADAVIASAMGVSNAGRLVSPEVRHRKFRFHPSARHVEELEEEFDYADRFVTISVTRVQFTEAMFRAMTAASKDVDCDLEVQDGRSHVEAMLRSQRRVDSAVGEAVRALLRVSERQDEAGQEALKPQMLVVQDALKMLRDRTEVYVSGECMRQAAEAERLVTSAYANEAAASTEELRKVRHAQLRISLLQREQANAARMDAMVAGEKAARAARDALRKMTAEERKQPAKEIGEQLAAVAANLRGVHRGVAGCVGSSAGLPAHQEAASARRE